MLKAGQLTEGVHERCEVSQAPAVKVNRCDGMSLLLLTSFLHVYYRG